MRRPTSDQALLITGATGTLGQALARGCAGRGLAYRLTSRAELDLADEASIGRALEDSAPWGVINAAGWVRVDDAEADPAGCLEANATGAARLGQACAARGLAFASFSSDLVFDGEAGRPYVETDPPNPLNVYGRSKALAEREILALGGPALVVRTSAFFSSYDPYNFAAHVTRALAAGEQFTAADDLVVSPTYVPDLVEAVLDLIVDGETGLWHLANVGAVSWSEFARKLARATGLDADLVQPVASARFGWPARRPRYVPLASVRGRPMPTLEDAIARYAAALRDGGFLPPSPAGAPG